MNDNEIIKALECCVYSVCKNCPYNKISHCTEENTKDALALINSQKARIQELEEAKEDLNGTVKNLLEQFAEFKTEAIREFVERLKNNMWDLPTLSDEDGIDDYIDAEELKYLIDRIEKEMTGEGE